VDESDDSTAVAGTDSAAPDGPPPPDLEGTPADAEESDELLVDDSLPGRRLRPAPPEGTPAVRRKLIEALLALNFDEASAEAVARAVDDPRALLEQLKAPAELGVHGGTIRYVLTRVRNAAVLPIPTNPRVAGEVHYAAGGSGVGGIEALSVDGLEERRSGLVITAATQGRLKQDMQAAAEYVRASNPLRESVASQGVLLPTTLIPVRFAFGDGTAPQTILCTVDGSSRLTAAMDLWGLTPEEVLFELAADSSKLRGRTHAVRSLLDADVQALTEEDKGRLRTRTIPAQLVVGWEAEEEGLTFPDILDAYLGLLHVEPPTPWNEAATQDSRAEAVLDELQRRGRIGVDRRKYLAGHMTPDEAESAGYESSLDGRSAAIFYELDRRKNTNGVNRALRRIGMKNPTREDRLEVATELAMRPYRRAVGELNRRNPRQALPAALESLRPHDVKWSPTTADPDELLTAALAELASGEGKAARAELAVRGAFWLTRYSSLQKSSRTDPRLANEVLRELQAKDHGLRALHRAVVDGRGGIIPRQVREDGSIITTAAGEEPHQTDKWLRDTFPKPEPGGDGTNGAGSETEGGSSGADEPQPEDVLRDRIYSLRDQASTVALRVDDLGSVVVDDQPLVDRVGIMVDVADDIATELDRARSRVQYLGEVWRRTSDLSAG
jgi:hypothetical protein